MYVCISLPRDAILNFDFSYRDGGSNEYLPLRDHNENLYFHRVF